MVDTHVILQRGKYKMTTPLPGYFFNTKGIISLFCYLEHMKELADEGSKLERTRTLNLFRPVNAYVLLATCKVSLFTPRIKKLSENTKFQIDHFSVTCFFKISHFSPKDYC